MPTVLQLLRDMIAFIETILARARIDCNRQTVAEGRDNTAIVAALGRSQQQVLGGEKEVAGANYGTDGSKLSRAGIQTVVCGPGNISQAHTANEFIEIEQVELATRIYGHMLSTWH